MRVKQLNMENFRGFGKIAVKFEERLTVLTGINGSGKSSVLHALALLFSQLSTGIRTTQGKGRRLADADVASNACFARVEVQAEVQGRPATWSLVHYLPGQPRELTSSLTDLREPIGQVQASIRAGGAVALPLAVFYSVHRAVLDIPRRIRVRHRFDPLAGYDEALVNAGTNFRLFFEWFREREDIENEQIARAGGPAAEDNELKAVRGAVERLIPEFTKLHIQRSPHRMVVFKAGQPFSIEQLSDGEKCLLALAGDLARRLVLANPNAPSPLDEAAIVLIDEIDLHLHPEWQRLVVPRLQATFPQCQFVITTHSPQVLASVPTTAVRELRDFVVYAAASTEGRDSNAILSQVMHVPAWPVETRKIQEQVASAIDRDDFAGAQQALNNLASLLTEDDAEVVRWRTMLSFLVEDSHAIDQQKA